MVELRNLLETPLGSLWEMQRHELHAKLVPAAAAHVKETFANAGQKPPPQLRLVEAREELLSVWDKTGTLEAISPRVLRMVPFFVFAEPDGTDSPVAGRGGFRDAYLRWIHDRNRSTSLAALARMFLQTYPTRHSWFVPWREALVRELGASRGPAAERWWGRIERYRLLAEYGPRRFAEILRDARELPAVVLAAAGLDGELAHARFLEFSLRSVLDLVAEEIRSQGRVSIVEPLLATLQDGHQKLRFESLRADLASALLSPFRNGDPHQPGLKDCIRNALLMLLGDPRLEPSKWASVADEDRRTMLRWLTAAAFDTFMRILDLTADERWRARREFWEAYLPRDGRPGALVEAWPVLGPEAATLAKTQLKMGANVFGTMRAEDRRQSVLIMRLHGPTGDATVCEWSHMGAVRVWGADDEGAPQFYQASYNVRELRGRTTKWFAHDAPGSWEAKLRNLIRHETGAQPRIGAKWTR